MRAEKVYSVVRTLGQGGMAKLSLAYSHLRRENVVLKQMTLKADEAGRGSFLNEALLSLKLTHPNIVRVYDVFESQGQLFIEMEWIPGRSLEQLLRARASSGLPASIVCRVMYDVCQALHAAHHATDSHGRRLEVVHRDVKPSNVMVGLGGVTKVIDFGIAWSARATAPAAHELFFSPGYLAPERALELLRTVPGGDEGLPSEPVPVDGRSDQFCAGVLLFEMLAGRLPIPPPADVSVSVPSQVAHCQQLARCQVDVSALPTELAAVAAKALARRPEDRYGSCQEMAEALARACPLASPEEVGRFLRECFPDAQREAEEGQRVPDATAELRTLAIGAMPGPAALEPRRAPRMPSLPGARGEPAWATAGALNGGSEDLPAPPPERKPSRWGWGLAFVLVLGAAGAVVLRENGWQSLEAVLREHGWPALDSLLRGEGEPPSEPVTPVPAPTEVPPASPVAQPQTAPEVPTREAPSVQAPPNRKKEVRQGTGAAAIAAGVQPVEPPALGSVDAGSPTRAEPSLNAEAGGTLVDGEAGGGAPRVEKQVEPEDAVPGDGSPAGALEADAGLADAPVSGEVPPPPSDEPRPSSPAQDGGARDADAAPPSGAAAAPEAGVEATPGPQES
ncbi:serine/threonine-protein kinase [Pyxidicoccus caerfyrddinensis]|uniref:serine/threonine-protein kinase n=1 Tax=Pyxidicoccus caerfyrddinensis TaxID=2709663 RepID=UPI0013D9B701|nr:serine/threonine-protein kinase [Pyxidicoccus caerfyrddinensis]